MESTIYNMDKREFKDAVYTVLAKLIKAMANPHRLEIIDLLAQGERSVEQIATETNISVANASQHLQTLKQAKLVDTRREWNIVLYRLASDNVYRSWKDLQAIGFRSHSEIDKLVKDYRKERNSLEPVNLQELLTRMRTEDIVLLDVRPEQEFKAGHIPAAINIPVEQLTKRLNKLSKSKQYIAYCRGPLCVFADEAVQLLTRKGFKANRLEEGFPDWKLKYKRR